MAKLLAGQYEALKDCVKDALKKEFELNISQSELDDLINKEKNKLGGEYLILEQELQEIESQYTALKKREEICIGKIKNIVEKDLIEGYYQQKITCFQLNHLLTIKAKKIARENGLIRNLSTSLDKLVSKEVYMVDTHKKNMDEILNSVIDRCRKEINSNLSKYLK